jgi:type VI secretion system secreted protein Hcp
MATSVHLWLKANGVDIAGDSTKAVQADDNVENTIECLSFHYKLSTQTTGQQPTITGKRVHYPVEITKRFDKSSPNLFRALVQNEIIEATFKFYRPDPAAGAPEHYFTYMGGQGRLVTVESESALILDASKEMYPDTEKVSFVFKKLRWTYIPDNVETEDTWEPS